MDSSRRRIRTSDCPFVPAQRHKTQDTRHKPHYDTPVGKRRALITGITGQDGSYLADFLLSKGYAVHGAVRRSSTENFERIAHIKERLHLHQADLLDELSLIHVLKEVRPHEVYGLAAQSFVPTSWIEPVLTGEFTALGVTRLLEAVRLVDPKIRFYQASSSEMFGMVRQTPQSEKTPFYPRSPYGVAKVYGHWITVNYRESYDLFACSGILFNHECVTAETPVIIRRDGLLDCVPISELVPDVRHRRTQPVEFEVWDRRGFVRARHATANWNGPKNDRRVHRLIARCGEVRVTADHVVFTGKGESRAEALEPGTTMETIPLPEPAGLTSVSRDWAWLMGVLAADGWIGFNESKYAGSFRNNDDALRARVAQLWTRLTGGSTSDHPGRSGWTGEPTGGVRFNGPTGILHWLHDTLYTRQSRHKRVPQVVLNADAETWRAFLSGYNAGDGLKAGHGDREFKNFKTSSPVLAAGLWWMASRVLDQKLTFNSEFVTRDDQEVAYYSINLWTEGGPVKGRHLLKPGDEIKQIRSEDYEGWLYDLETDSGTFHAGIGSLLIHNSPRRGIEFVTRKITHNVARIKLGLRRTLRLGNLDSKRDWGFAGDYVRAMWLMLQQKRPDDFVIGTGEMHSVREFCELAFARAGLDWRDHVRVDPKLIRPAEVHRLCADPRKARRKLGWRPTVGFKQLVHMMVDADLDSMRHEDSAR